MMKTEILTHSDRYWATHKLYVKDNQKNVVKWAQEILNNGGIGKTKRQKELLVKIENYIKRNYLDKAVNDVLVDITTNQNTYAVVQFSIEITRQNISEKVQVEHLKNKGFKITKMGNASAPRFSKDSKKLTHEKMEGETSRSFDYKVEKENGHVDYGLGKTTFSQGGGQNSAKSEIVQFLNSALKYCEANPDEKISFFALIDGDSYTKEDLSGFLKHTSEKVRVCNSDTYL
jgi:hypothetical protein